MMDNFMHPSYQPKAAHATCGELLAGRLVLSPGTRYSIISPCRCSGGGQQSATVVLLFTSGSTYGARRRCQMLWPSPRTDHHSVAVAACLLSEDTRRLNWSGAKSIRYSMNIMYTVVGQLSPNKIRSALESEAELRCAFSFLELDTFSN